MWNLEFIPNAEKEFLYLDVQVRNRIISVVDNKLLKNPEVYLVSLLGEKSGLHKFKIGAYRLICVKNKKENLIQVVKIGHRKNVYR